jgi:predicted RNA-binding Zn ribbon-like protein
MSIYPVMKSPEHPFLFGSGSLALDLVNTARIEDGRSVEDLGSPRDAVAWLDAGGLIVTDDATALHPPPAARVLLGEARGLRGAIERAIEAAQRGDPLPEPSLYAINRVLGASRASALLGLEEGRAFLVELEAGEGPLAALAPVARAAADLLIATDPGRVRRCASESCTRWFVDTSKAGRRKWCSMATCGNRAKATRHRRRRSA